MLVTSPGEQLTDQELLERFEDGTLSHEYFHHREHVRAAFLYLTNLPVLEALQSFSRALRDSPRPRGSRSSITRP
jgi:hypothetical protein